MTPAQSMIGRVWSIIERVLSCAPFELASIDNDASDSCAVPPKPFGERVNDDISTVLDGSSEAAMAYVLAASS